MQKLDRLLDVLLFGVIAFHLVVSPYSKVEESFTMQAVHDVVNYGVALLETVQQHYDHMEFPGVVPRTFIGSAVLGAAVKAVAAVGAVAAAAAPLGLARGAPGELFGDFWGSAAPFGGTQRHLQFVVRALIGVANFGALVHLRNTFNAITARDRRSRTRGVGGAWFSVLLLLQFHLLYYATRTLPNFVCLPLVNFAVAKILRGDATGLTWLAFVGVVFRLEVGVLAAIIAVVSSLVFGQSSIVSNVVMLAAGSVVGAVASGAVDLYFWGYWVVPEVSLFVFNVVEGRLKEWGVEPWGAYFNKYLWAMFRPPVVLLMGVPGLLLDPAEAATDEAAARAAAEEILETKAKAAAGVTEDTAKGVTEVSTAKRGGTAANSLRILYLLALLYILAMSTQPHKEWRFIIYVAPIFTLQAANALANISTKWSLSLLSRLLVVFVLANVALGAALSLFMGYASSFNYPGGDALAGVNANIVATATGSPLVHLDVPTCMTGALRFGELRGVRYDKTENATALAQLWPQFDYVVGDAQLAQQPQFDPQQWQLVHVAQTFQGVTPKPVLELLGRQKQQGGAMVAWASQVVRELLHTGQSPSFARLANAMVLRDDYLYAWKRVSS